MVLLYLPCDVGGEIRVARDDGFSYQMRSCSEPQNPQNHGVKSEKPDVFHQVVTAIHPSIHPSRKIGEKQNDMPPVGPGTVQMWSG